MAKEEENYLWGRKFVRNSKKKKKGKTMEV